MWTRTSDYWKKLPGSFDPLHLRHQFPSKDKYHFPFINAPSKASLPEPPSALIPYNIRIRSKHGYDDSAIHFFLDDYRFEFVWNKPEQAFSRIERAGVALTPDFSLFADYPLAAQIWNTYRNRWCGAFWQYREITVIPTISWAGKESFDFCFSGVEEGSPVAIGTVGMKKESIPAFELGYAEMIRRINPRFVLCYGKKHKPLQDMFPDVQLKYYDSYWKLLKKAKKEGREEQFYAGDVNIHAPE